VKLALAATLLAGCGQAASPATAIKFLHTFGADETEVFNATMAERGIAVESSLVPFARGQQVISAILTARANCPDLIRIDATWLPGLQAANLLAPVPTGPESGVAADWLPEAAALVGPAPLYALPETVDGLLVVRDEAAPAPASASIADLLAAARAAQYDARRYPLGVRVDGYWFVAWLRAAGAELVATPPTPASDASAVKALASFASVFGTLAPPPPPQGSEAPDELRRWTAHDVAYWVTGPWQLGALRDRDRIAISPLAHAPRGGQLLVVPTCAQHPDEGWKLARELTSVEVERVFAEAFATVPTRKAALDAAPPLVHAEYEALRSADMLPRAPVTPLLFDDLNPAIAAVVAGDASPTEAMRGVRRGWLRLGAPTSPGPP
jgi:ABC-type glycerol-3-phosphate transport system substrate-binding protein